ncbi:hypothetical protein LshimejAT787_0103980 [Lyophyllum shimeji]|uniref:Uncharacterized protein n=1 Tax=Lyophyllum shimeji TaxID=47721 RepID=A0A9P3PD97_LYOSH|nr:hypothetical protein LshimejAT787_0103980 [Lyophyllum shimeji]
MPYAGEEPITSFFHRVPSRQKRKESSDISTRKRPQPDTEANKPLASSKKPKVQQKLVLRDASKNRGYAANVTAPARASAETVGIGRMESLTSVARSSSATPPSVQVLFRDASAAPASSQCITPLPTPVTTRLHVPAQALQTPPSTDLPEEEVPRPSTDFHTVIFSSSKPKLEDSTNPVLTPVTTARPTTVAHVIPGNRELSCTLSSRDASPNESNVPNGPLAPVVSIAEDSSSKTWNYCGLPSPTLSQTVPSSQSQHDGLEAEQSSTYCAVDQSESSTSRQAPIFLSPRLPDRILREVSSKPPFVVETPVLEDDDGHRYVHSSQSQHMLPFHVSPRKNRDKAQYHSSSSPVPDDATLSSGEEVIPSSQSQIETELDMSRRISEYCPLPLPMGAATESSSSRNFDWYASPPEARRLPLGEGPSARGTVNESLDNGSTAGRLPAIEDPNSATEDESENEDAAVPPDRPAGDAEDQGVSQSQEVMDYPSTLPDAVKEFRAMFGEGEGSYPDDFPMSLR